MLLNSKVTFIILLLFLGTAVITNVSAAQKPAALNSKDSTSHKDSSGTALPDSTHKDKNAIKDTIYYESSLISYDNEAKILYLTGKANIKYQNLKLIADTIVYTINDDLFTASGLPKLIDGNDTTIGDHMVYNIKTRRGRVSFASTHLTEGSFNGSNIIKTGDNSLYVDQGDYTTCENIDSPHYYFYGKRIKVIPKEKIISKPVVMNIGDAPVAVLPFFIFPLDRNRRSGFLTPIWGGNPASGGYVDNIGYYWAPNDYIDLIARGKVDNFQKYEIGVGSSYALKYKFSGHLNARYAFNNDFLGGNRDWAIDYAHDQTLTPDNLTRLSGSGTLSSTNYFSRNSIRTDELTKPKVNANMSLSKTFEKINASTNLTWRRVQDLENGIIDEDLPSISFSLPSRPIIKAPDSLTGDKVPWYSKIYFDYGSSGLVKHIDSTKESHAEYFRPGAQHSLNLSSPQKLFGYVNVTPTFRANQYFVYNYSDSATLRIDTLIDSMPYIKYPPFAADNNYPDYTMDTLYDTLSRDQYGKPDSIRVTKFRKRIIPRHNTYEQLDHIEDWNTGLNLSTNLYGIFPVKVLNLLGIRHTFTPSLSYTFSPEYNSTRLYQNSAITPPSPRKQAQVVGLSIGNLFEGKLRTNSDAGQPVDKTFKIVSVNLSTGYDFERKTRKWNDLSLSASTAIDKLGLSLDYSSSFWLYDQYNTISPPIMSSMSLHVSSRTLGAKGTLWDGDMFDLDSLIKPDDHLATEPKKNALEWSASLNPSFEFSMSRGKPGEMFIPKKTFNLSGAASLNFTKAWSIRWGGTYNFERAQWVNNSFDLSCDLECWEMKFNWRPEKLNPGYYFLINIKKIPEIKWEQRD